MTTWKEEERRTCAKLIGMKRNELSGRGGGGGTSGDCRCKTPGCPMEMLYVEIKHYAKMAIFTLFRDTKQKRQRENREHEVVITHQKGTKLRLATIDFDWFVELLSENVAKRDAS